MKRIFLALLLLLLASVASAHDGWSIAIRNDRSFYINGHFSDGEVDGFKERYGRTFAVFTKDGDEYVITDRDAIEKLEDLFEPQSDLGRKQGELGRKQGELGREQGRLGREQGRLAREQARVARGDADDDEVEALAAKQRELAAAQRELSARQRELGERQRELGERQKELSRQIERDLERFVATAVRNGTAKKR